MNNKHTIIHDGIDLDHHEVLETELDTVKGTFTVKVGSWTGQRLGMPRLTSDVVFSIPVWNPDYGTMADEFMDTHPYWGGFGVTRTSADHLWNPIDLQWFAPPPDIEALKTAKWSEIKLARSAAEYGGFEWDGSVFDSDFVSQQRINGAVTLAQMSPSFTIDWILADNSARTLNAADMCAVGAALGVHVATQFAHAQSLRIQLDAAQTPEAIASITF